MDTFSNILFVKELSAPLSQLAHKWVAHGHTQAVLCLLCHTHIQPSTASFTAVAITIRLTSFYPPLSLVPMQCDGD